VSAQRGRSAVEASHRSIHPNIPGVPWWGALLIAITASAIGYAIDAGSGHKELTHVFAVFYVAGCVVAALAVRQEGVFTAIIQPPLILFCAVPGAYWLFHGRKVGHLKDLLINCGYPLIERFPLMLGTAGGVLLIGLVRWYFGMSYRTAATADTNDADAATPAETRSFFGAITAKLNSVLGLASREDGSGDTTGAKRTRAGGSPRKAASTTGRAARSDGSAARPGRTHTRHARRPLEDEQEPVAERPRRRRPAPPRDVDPADPTRRPRRRPPHSDPERRAPERRAQPRDTQPRETHRDPRPAPRNPYEWPYERAAPHTSRFDDHDRHDHDRHEPPHEPQRRRGMPGGNGDNPTHHPISRVRYRRSGPLDEARAEPGAEYRSRPRSRRPPAESWEYDV
jgi:hypothetical protein